MNSNYHTGTLLTIHPTYIVATPEWSGPGLRRSKLQRKSESNLSNNDHQGKLSRKAQTRLRNSVNWLIESAKRKAVRVKSTGQVFYFKVNFITLTIPKVDAELADEKIVKKALHNWLVFARKYMYLKNYVWKVEQHKSGQLHIHLTTDTFIHYRKLRSSWNKCLQHHGLLDEYIERSGDNDPNSTDVHSVKHVKNLGAYISKYMAKDAGMSSKFKGRIWGCNYDLSSENKCQVVVSRGEEYEKMRELQDRDVEWKVIEGKEDAMGRKKRIGEIYYMRPRNWRKMRRSVIGEAYDTHRFYIRSQAQKPPPEYFSIDYFGGKMGEKSDAISKFDVTIKKENTNEEQERVCSGLVRCDQTANHKERQLQMHFM